MLKMGKMGIKEMMDSKELLILMLILKRPLLMNFGNNRERFRK
jgi:hypothetical protein